MCLAKDLSKIYRNLDRTLYALTSYKTSEAYRRWTPARQTEDGFEHKDDENPNPGPEDLRAVAAWGDIDLRDELKGRRGGLDDDTLATAEETLAAYIDEFATLYGDRDAVYALDSVGGAYIFGAPEATLPIAEYFLDVEDSKTVGKILQEFIDRTKEWLKDAQDRVEARIDGAGDVIDPDWPNNHNRQYKTPLAIHRDHAAVVTPIDTDDIDYSITPLEDVDEDLIEDGVGWAEAFTAREHDTDERVDHLVDQLWPDYADDADDWREVLESWLENERAAEQRKEALRSEATSAIEDDRNLDLADVPVTPYVEDVKAAIDDLDIYDVADRTVVDHWTETLQDAEDRSGSGKKAIVPVWANGYNTGNATYIDKEKGIFHDTADGQHGTAVEMALISNERWYVGEIATGEDWARGVRYLQELGYEIPVWTPDAQTAVDADQMPYWSLRRAAQALGVVAEEDLVEREGKDGGTYLSFSDRETYRKAVQAVEEAGLDTGRDPDGETDEHRPDPREIGATVDVRRAWNAAGRVDPDDVDADLPDAPDVVRAVAVAEGLIDSFDEPIEEEYPRAYELAREKYDAPLPEYYTTADAISEFDVILDVIGEVTFWDLRPEALESDITAEGTSVDGQAVRALDPAWRESESGESVLVFESGNVWDADSKRALDPIRFVALDSGLIDNPTVPVEGETFTEAYRRLRDEYGAPLPHWDPAYTGDSRDLTPQLPASDELVNAREFSGVDLDALDKARQEVEHLIRKAVRSGDLTVVTSLPATGKTTGTIKAALEQPLSYLAARKELQQQALEKAEKWGVDAVVLPVFSEERVRDDVLNAAVSHVREAGKNRLRNRWGVLDAALKQVGADKDDGEEDLDPSDIFSEGDKDDVNLERPTCPTAEGEHGVAWALVVHVARRLGYTPQEIHTQARGLFGAELPCDASCEYSDGWDRVTDPDAPADLLIGSYVHAHVPSVSRYIHRDENGSRAAEDRAIVLDEFPGEAFTTEYGEEALDFATWLGSNLRKGVDDRRDMFGAELYDDEFVRAWLDGVAEDTEAVGETVDVLARFGELFEAREAAEDILRRVDDDLLENFSVREVLQTIADGGDPAEALHTLDAALGDVDRHHPAANVVDWIEEAVRDALAAATNSGSEPPTVDGILDDLPVDGDLAQLVADTVEAVRAGKGHAEELVGVAVTALCGGREGCRRLAAWADDGYAHPNAHHLLTAVITPTGDGEPGSRVDTDTWAFDSDATEGTIVDAVDTGSKARTVVDRNDHGALLHTPPASDVPVVGLDATGRRSLWSVALQDQVTSVDIHDSPEERAEFLENALDLRVLQAADRPRFYEGDPTTKDTDGDVALLEAIADEYAGIEAPRERGDKPVSVGKPAAITTKGVRDLLEDDERLEDVVAAWENYGNVKGANHLGDHRLAALLGCQHFGDDAIERFAALDGREVDTSRESGRGDCLEYGDDLADDYFAHMTEDQTMQAILRFARGDSGATVVARTSALRDDLPVIGDAQVVDTWSDTATAIARAWRRLGDEFTVSDVAQAVDVDVSKRHVRRVLSEFVDAGYVQRLKCVQGQATLFGNGETPGAGEVNLIDRDEALAIESEGGQSRINQYYTWSVRVPPRDWWERQRISVDHTRNTRAPPAPMVVDRTTPG